MTLWPGGRRQRIAKAGFHGHPVTILPSAVLLGRIQWHQGERHQAVETLEYAVKLPPDESSLYYMLAHYYETLGRRNEAAKAMQTYKDLKGEQKKENEAGRR